MAISYRYKGIKFPPLTPNEIEEKLKETKEEMQEVLEWKKEEEARFNNPNSKPQVKSAAKRALVKVARRIDTVKGNSLYWKLRKEGKSHFHAQLERAEFWDKLKNPEGDDIDVEK